MRLEEGKFYRSSTGEKVGPMIEADKDPIFYVNRDIGRWYPDGSSESLSRPDLGDLIAEWTDGPVRTVTRREVVPGNYGRLKTLNVSPSGVSYTKAIVSLEERFYSREDLTEIIDLLAEVRDGLELAGALEE